MAAKSKLGLRGRRRSASRQRPDRHHIGRMAEDVDNLVLEHLLAIRAGNDKTHQMLFDLTQRIASLEQKAASAAVDLANINGRLDGFEKKLARIKKRLGLIEA